jgi:hypothetical protein
MRADAIWQVIWGFLKIVLLAALVMLGIIFVPDGIFDRIERGIDAAAGFFTGKVQENTPGVVQDASQQIQETKNEIQGFYQRIKDEYYPSFIDWLAQAAKKF